MPLELLHEDGWWAVTLLRKQGATAAAPASFLVVAEAYQTERWVEAASEAKGLPEGSPLRAEEWQLGPWALAYVLTGSADELARATRPAFLADDVLDPVQRRIPRGSMRSIRRHNALSLNLLVTDDLA